MAIIEDIEPPSEKEGGSKFFKKISSFIGRTGTLARKSLQRAIFWLRHEYSKYRVFIDEHRVTSPKMVKIRKNSPHAVILTLTALVIISNIVVRTTKADLTQSIADPSSEIAFSSKVDQYTPLIFGDGQAVESAYFASSEEFTALGASVATNMTERTEPLPDNSTDTVSYVVRPGDTLTGLGWKFGVKLGTLRYVNKLSNVDMIQPGQKLRIPPEGYVVASSTIAAWEKSLTASKYASSSSSSSSKKVKYNPGSKSNGYPWGWCTYYVATRRFTPSQWGNARSWLYSAQRSGYSTGSSPAAGAIVITRESWWGHVAYVESVGNGTITIAEMNGPAGWGRVGRRTISAYGGVVRGYIY